jgi:hypothetical protein
VAAAGSGAKAYSRAASIRADAARLLALKAAMPIIAAKQIHKTL